VIGLVDPVIRFSIFDPHVVSSRIMNEYHGSTVHSMAHRTTKAARHTNDEPSVARIRNGTNVQRNRFSPFHTDFSIGPSDIE
jgi:hypothetical protein